MRYDADLAARAADYLALPLNEQRSPGGLETLAQLWAAIQQRPAGSCRQCQYSDYRRDVAAYVREFSSLTTSSAMSDTQSTYQIAPAFASHDFVHESYGKVVNANNLTDEDAEFFIKHGRKDAFVKKGSAEAEATEPAEGGDTQVTAENPLVPQADLEAEQAAHADTKQQGADALAAEKEAHKATKKELTEVKKQLATAQKQLDKVAKVADEATDKDAPEGDDAK